jgi:quercetin dioxygenase-like cupin family protein
MNAYVLGFASMGVGIGLGLVLSAVSVRARSVVKRWTMRVFGALRPRPSGFIAIHAEAIEWRENQLHRDRTRFFMKPLPHEDEHGHSLMLVRYAAGQVNPNHVHSIGHGMYVLRGELVTHRGSFGPDTFVWFPANEVMWHGAGPAEDLVVLFSTSYGLDTRFVVHGPG